MNYLLAASKGPTTNFISAAKRLRMEREAAMRMQQMITTEEDDANNKEDRAAATENA